MIQYIRCSQASSDLLFEAFNNGFSDYMIKFKPSKEEFLQRFLGPEGNSLEHSFVALDEKKGIGLILGGIKAYEGIKTLRCGALAVHPQYRGKEIAYKLFELHKEEGLKHDCRQLFLEVIKGNDRAIAFYRKLGYEKCYDLYYFSLDDLSRLQHNNLERTEIKKINAIDFEKLIASFNHIHINWQNDTDYLKATNTALYYASYQQDEPVGFLALHSHGKISYLWVNRSFRGKGVASTLLQTACTKANIQKVTLSFPNNSLLYGFAKRTGFSKDPLSQYEMYLTLA